MIAGQSGAMGASALARHTGASRGTVHQRLATLVDAGWVERVDGGRYRLSLHAARVGQAALEQASLGQRVLPAIERLAAATGEAASLAVLEGDSAVIVQRVESGHILRADLRVGTAMPLASTASGMVLVAFAPASRRARLRERLPGLLSEEEAAEVRARGSAHSIGRFLPGITAVAAPVVDGGGRVIAALSVAGPSSRFVVEDGLPPLLEAAQAINRETVGRTG